MHVDADRQNITDMVYNPSASNVLANLLSYDLFFGLI